MKDVQGIIDRGLGRQKAAFEGRIASGSERLGWKVAFNALSVQRSLSLPYSLIAGLTRETLLDDDGTYEVPEGGRVALEAEVAVRLGMGLTDDTPDDVLAEAVEAWAPAIEIVEFDRPLDELEEVLAEGVFHRALAIGPWQAAPPGAPLSGIPAAVTLDGVPVCDVDAGEATGEVPALLGHIARLLARYGAELRAGDVLILGSMNPPCMASAPARFRVDMQSLGSVSVRLLLET
jgi:2-keto-4-pentenoate hydratase